MRPRAVQVAVNAVPGPVHEVLAEAGGLDHRPRRPIAEVAEDRLPARRATLHGGDGRVARVAHGGPDRLHPLRHRAPREAHPGLVGEDRPLAHPAPQIEQHHLVVLQHPVGARMRLVVRVGGVRPETHDRMRGEEHPRPFHGRHHFLLQRRLAQPHPRPAHRAMQGVERDLPQQLRGLEVLRRLGLAPRRREARHEIGARHHRHADTLQQVHHAPRNPIQIRDGVTRRDLHRGALPPQRPFQRGLQLGVPREGNDRARKTGERLHLDLVHDRHHRPLARDPHEGAPRHHPAREETLRHRVAAVKVEQEPAVGAEALQRGRDHGAVDPMQRGHSYPPASAASQTQLRSPRPRQL